MSSNLKRPALGVIFYFGLMFSLGLYFTFASVQGDYGLFERVQIEAEVKELQLEHERLAANASVRTAR